MKAIEFNKTVSKLKKEYKGIHITLNPDLGDILGASRCSVHVRGTAYFNDVNIYDSVVVAMSAKTYLKMVKDIIKRKAGYSTNWGHYCGHFILCVLNYTVDDYTYLNECIDCDKAPIEHLVPICYASEIVVDMEHG